jgi:phage-related protein
VQLADSKAQTANISASLTQLQGFIGSMHTADADYNAKLDAINAQFTNLKQELSNATRTPLPADCKPTADRLRVLSDAVSAANQGAAAGK